MVTIFRKLAIIDIFSFLLLVASSRSHSVARSRKRLWGWFSSTILSNLSRVVRRNGLAWLRFLKRGPKRTRVLILRTRSVLASRARSFAALLFPEPWAGERCSEHRLSWVVVGFLSFRDSLLVIRISESGPVPFSVLFL